MNPISWLSSNIGKLDDFVKNLYNGAKTLVNVYLNSIVEMFSLSSFIKLVLLRDNYVNLINLAGAFYNHIYILTHTYYDYIKHFLSDGYNQLEIILFQLWVYVHYFFTNTIWNVFYVFDQLFNNLVIIIRDIFHGIHVLATTYINNIITVCFHWFAMLSILVPSYGNKIIHFFDSTLHVIQNLIVNQLQSVLNFISTHAQLILNIANIVIPQIFSLITQKFNELVTLLNNYIPIFNLIGGAIGFIQMLSNPAWLNNLLNFVINPANFIHLYIKPQAESIIEFTEDKIFELLIKAINKFW